MYHHVTDLSSLSKYRCGRKESKLLCLCSQQSDILVKDPTGRIIPVIAVAAGYIAKRAAVGALASVAVYYATSEITGPDTTLGGNKINNCISCYRSIFVWLL